MKNLIFTFFTLAALLFSSCITDYDGGFFGGSIKGEGPVVSKALSLDGFTKIGLATSGELYLSQGDSYSVKAEAQQNIIDNLETKVEGETLKIGFDKSVSNYKSLKFYITMPALKGVSVAGSGDVAGETPFTGLDVVSLNIAGSGNINLNIEANSVEASISGSGNVELEGEAGKAEVNIMGSGSVDAAGLKAQKADISIAGSGDCTIDATEQLDVSIAGSGDVFYLGSPQIDKSIAGSGSVERK